VKNSNIKYSILRAKIQTIFREKFMQKIVDFTR